MTTLRSTPGNLTGLTEVKCGTCVVSPGSDGELTPSSSHFHGIPTISVPLPHASDFPVAEFLLRAHWTSWVWFTRDGVVRAVLRLVPSLHNMVTGSMRALLGRSTPLRRNPLLESSSFPRATLVDAPSTVYFASRCCHRARTVSILPSGRATITNASDLHWRLRVRASCECWRQRSSARGMSPPSLRRS